MEIGLEQLMLGLLRPPRRPGSQTLPWLWRLWVMVLLLAAPSPSGARQHPTERMKFRARPASVDRGSRSTASSWLVVAGVLALTAAVGVAVVGASFFKAKAKERAAAGARRTQRASAGARPRENKSSFSFSLSLPSLTWLSFSRSNVRDDDSSSAPAAGQPSSSGPRQAAVGQQQQHRRRRPAAGGRGGEASALALREYEYEVLEAATGRFERRKRVGQGSAGVVFAGELLGDDGVDVPVAVKRFHNTLTEESCKHVRRDLTGRFLQHRNVVRLHGYCLRKGKLCLVYDYMPNGSLHRHLFGGEGSSSSASRLSSWARRSNIIRGVALGLHHLHSQGTVHGSVKASNILIEKDFTARVGDFGYSRAEPSKLAALAPSSAGGGGGGGEAFYYVAPECRQQQQQDRAAVPDDPTYEMDVFYFGAVVLEVVTGRRSCGGGDLPGGGGGNARFLVDWVWALHGRGCILDAVDATLLQHGDLNGDEAEKMLLVGLACSHPDPNRRPKMEQVVEMLQPSAGSAAPLPEVPPSRPEYDEHAQATECRVTVQAG